jgi:hypothetical protein
MATNTQTRWLIVRKTDPETYLIEKADVIPSLGPTTSMGRASGSATRLVWLSVGVHYLAPTAQAISFKAKANAVVCKSQEALNRVHCIAESGDLKAMEFALTDDLEDGVRRRKAAPPRTDHIRCFITNPKFLRVRRRFSLRFNSLGLKQGERDWLHGDGGDQIESLLLLCVGMRGEGEGSFAVAGAPGPQRVAHDGGQMRQEAREAHRRRAIRLFADEGQGCRRARHLRGRCGRRERDLQRHWCACA